MGSTFIGCGEFRWGREARRMSNYVPIISLSDMWQTDLRLSFFTYQGQSAKVTVKCRGIEEMYTYTYIHTYIHTYTHTHTHTHTHIHTHTYARTYVHTYLYAFASAARIKRKTRDWAEFTVCSWHSTASSNYRRSATFYAFLLGTA
jgi:hypothetical protein